MGHSMEPSLPPGSVFLFQRDGKQSRTFHPEEVVLLRLNGETWIKRIYATGGTRFWAMQEIDGDRRYTRPIRAGQRHRFSRIAHFQRAQSHPCKVVQLRVPTGKVFVVGDGLSSHDSREFGPIAESEIVGRVITSIPRGVAEMPDWVELSFPSHSSFDHYGLVTPPAVLKREEAARKVQPAIRVRLLRNPRSGTA